jgi:hypothetical protein
LPATERVNRLLLDFLGEVSAGATATAAAGSG